MSVVHGIQKTGDTEGEGEVWTGDRGTGHWYLYVTRPVASRKNQ